MNLDFVSSRDKPLSVTMLFKATGKTWLKLNSKQELESDFSLTKCQKTREIEVTFMPDYLLSHQ